MTTICCIATGPSVTAEQVAVARANGWTLYVCNDAFRLAPDATLLHACNWQWWDRRWDEVKSLPCEKWTTRKESAVKYGLHYIEERAAFGCGLSEDTRWLHHGHGSGFQLLGMAYRARPARIIMLGYDLKYAPDYDGAARHVGSMPRHFFGEYEPELQHWPRKSVDNGVHWELRSIYTAIADFNKQCEFVNCSPGSALTALPMADIREVRA